MILGHRYFQSHIRKQWLKENKDKQLMESETHPGVESGGVAGAGVVVGLALWIRAAVDPDAGAGSELVSRGAKHRVGRRSPRLQAAGQRTGAHQELWHQNR